MGTIIAVNKTAEALVESILEIVDGQQRITTLTLLLLAVYSELSERKSSLEEDQLSDLSQLRRMFVLGKPTRTRVRLQQQNRNNDDFHVTLVEAGISVDDPPAPKVTHVGNRRIKRAFRFFEDAIRRRYAPDGSDAVDVLFDVLLRVKRTVLVTLEVESHADAFVLFESLNNRGLPLSPIDLIKNSLLAQADRVGGVGIDLAYKCWDSWLSILGDNYADQERFFRQFYNAFKAQWDLTVANMAVATRARLITIYEAMLKGDFDVFSERMDRATLAYKRIISGGEDEGAATELDASLRQLSRVQGAPSYILLLNLMINQDELDIKDSELRAIVDLLTSFFVRRNLTNIPPTYALDRLFISMVEGWVLDASLPALEQVRGGLVNVSVSDDLFGEFLRGPVYDENSLITRFILVSLAEEGMTNELWVDLWQRSQVGKASGKEVYRWTIEHIVPQGRNLPGEWVEMLGGKEESQRVLEEEVHRLGNLTITGYNSTLGNRSFEEKRDRKDASGKFVGYRNGLELNAELANAASWTGSDIEKRTQVLVQRALEKFALTG